MDIERAVFDISALYQDVSSEPNVQYRLLLLGRLLENFPVALAYVLEHLSDFVIHTGTYVSFFPRPVTASLQIAKPNVLYDQSCKAGVQTILPIIDFVLRGSHVPLFKPTDGLTSLTRVQ